MKILSLIILSALSNFCIAQYRIDTSKVELQPIDVKLYFSKQSNLSITASSQYIGAGQIQQQANTNITHAINSIPGIRMEERSPGSYRLAIRGGMIRSPFGIRNTKIYLGDFPLTDAGGNTYLNLIDNQSIASLQVIKGPDASLFGANSGGVIQIQPNGWSDNHDKTELTLSAGSFNTFKEHISLSRKISPTYSFSIDQGYTKSEGYRDNTGSSLKTFQTTHQFKYSSNAHLKALLLYSDIGYNTPGGLTLSQFEENPKASRPSTNTTPSAKEQHAGIYNRTLYGGLSNEWYIAQNLSHHIAVYGSNTDFENPFITNYEFRKEKNFGVRTYLSILGKEEAQKPWQMQIGFEGIKGWFTINNFDNLYGIAGDAQAKDKIQNIQWNAFYRAQVNLLHNWLVEGSLGLNQFSITNQQLYPIIQNKKSTVNFDVELLPRIATSYIISPNAAWRASISKGYSTPTISEIRSSNNIFNNNLQAELGTNYETGFKYKSNNQKFLVDIGAYIYHMSNGIVRQIDANENEFYVNAGEMKQKGIELASWYIFSINKSWIREIKYQLGATYNHYRFGDYIDANKDYSGNKITSVPDYTLSNNLSIDFNKNISLNLTHQYNSKIPLNDANTVFGNKYNLIRSLVNINNNIFNKNISYYFSIDNLLNEKYSLGNDINAFGGRYFNAAPSRNFMIGLKLSL